VFSLNRDSYGSEQSDIDELPERTKYESPFLTYNHSKSEVQFLSKETVAEVICYVSIRFQEFDNCFCATTLSERQSRGEWQFHTEQCFDENDDYGDRVEDVVVRMRDGVYARIQAHGANPRDYNACAIWRSTDLNSLFLVDTDVQIR